MRDSSPFQVDIFSFYVAKAYKREKQENRVKKCKHIYKFDCIVLIRLKVACFVIDWRKIM